MSTQSMVQQKMGCFAVAVATVVLTASLVGKTHDNTALHMAPASSLSRSTAAMVNSLSSKGAVQQHRALRPPAAVNRQYPGHYDAATRHMMADSDIPVNNQGSESVFWAGLAFSLAALAAWVWRKPQSKPSELMPFSDPMWNMASVSVNPELLKRFGLSAPDEPAYPGLAESILERKAPGGIPTSSDNAELGYSKAEVAAMLQELYQTFDLDCPRMRIHSINPPVFTIEGFLGASDCDALMASTPSLLQPSTIGSGKLFSQGTELSGRRTSTSILLDETLLAARPSLAAPVKVLQSRAKTLFPESTWGAAGRLPRPGSICFEALQVARYQEGQYFLEHQDGFPTITAKYNQFQRLATVLIYLNDVEEGGQTRFPHLDLSISPKKGTALVFFPGFFDGRPDDRMLHEACKAVQEKWVAQQWVSVGVSPGKLASAVPTPSSSGTVQQPDVSSVVSEFAGIDDQRSKLDARMGTGQATKAKGKESKKPKGKSLGPKKGFGN